MATYTSHLNLKLPDYSDTADIKDLNDNFKKIDDAIASGGTGGGTGGGIVTETDPTVPSWAKQPSKPTYTAAEVGALPDTTVIPTVPSALPNPQPIVINGISYDGSERKEITVSAGDGGSITETDPTVPAWAKAENKPSYTAEEVGALPSTYKPPVTSVNGKTGAVSLVASDVGALPNTTVIPTVPTALKNPYPLTINGVSYDGSEAKTVTIESTGGGASVELDTTLTQYNKAADAGAVGNAIAQETAAREAAVNSLNEANAAQNTEIAKKANDADLAKVAKSGSYDDLTGKPTIPTVPSALPNPNKLKLTGAVTAEYDGSSEVRVEIPAGGGLAYELPIASATQLGGVMPVAATDEMTQAVGVDAEGKLFTAAGAGGWETLTAEETVLASGTIAADSTGTTNTGISLTDLKSWKTFMVKIINVASGKPYSLWEGSVISFNPGKSVFKFEQDNASLKKLYAIFEWADTQKTVLKPVSLSASNRGQYDGDAIGTCVQIDMNPSYWKPVPIAKYYKANFNGSLKIHLDAANTDSDITWEIRGMIK